MAFKLVTVQSDGSAATTARTLGNVLVDSAIAPIRAVMSSNEYVSKQEQGIASLVGVGYGALGMWLYGRAKKSNTPIFR